MLGMGNSLRRMSSKRDNNRTLTANLTLASNEVKTSLYKTY